MKKEHLKAIRINKAIGNYNKEYCEVCGKELDNFEDEWGRQKYITFGKICEECRDNLTN